MEVHINLEGMREVEAMLTRAPNVLMRALEAATDDSLTDLLAQMQTYPPQRAGTTYTRRNNLFLSWVKRRERRAGSIVSGRVTSSHRVAPYNIYVQRADSQAWMHRGVWTNTERVVVDRSRRRIENYFRIRINRAVASLGG